MSFLNHQNGSARTLPPINSLVSLQPCQNHIYGCPRLFSTLTELREHHRSCDPYQLQRLCGPTTGHVTRVDSFASDFPGLRHVVSVEHHSPSSVAAEPLSDSDSSCHSAVCTPNVSRESSLTREVPHRRSSQVTNRVTKRISRRGSTPLSGEVDRKVKKTEKEKLNRSNQAAVSTRVEDFIAHYTGWSRVEQSGGNGNAAGLQTNKINLLRVEEALLYSLIHDRRCEAIKSGTVAQFEAQMQKIADDAVDHDANPFDGYFLQSNEKPCTHSDTKSKRCATHGTADWRECRKQHSNRVFESNQHVYLQELGITMQQAYHGQHLSDLPYRAHHS